MKKDIIDFMTGKLIENLLTDELINTAANILHDISIEEADKIIDRIEEKAIESSSEIDDKIVLPLCNIIRLAYRIPDNDQN